MEEDNTQAAPDAPENPVKQNPLKRSMETDDPATKRVRRGPSVPPKKSSRKQQAVPRLKFFRERKENVATLHDFWGKTGDKVLVIGERDEKGGQCCVRTKEQYVAKFGTQKKEKYKSLIILLKDDANNNEYLSPRQFYARDSEGFDKRMDSYGLPRSEPGGPSESHGIEGLPNVIITKHIAGEAARVGMWYTSDSVMGKKGEITAWAEQYGKDNLYKRQPDGSYRKLDVPSLSKNWSAAADFMVLEGWPRAAVRAEDDRYIDIRDIRARHSWGEPREVLVLSKTGDSYLSPHELKELDANAYIGMMDEMGLPLALADARQEVGPEWLVCNGKYELLGGAAYEEKAKSVSDEHKLIHIQNIGGVLADSYKVIPEFLHVGQSILNRHADLANRSRTAAPLRPEATIEDRVRAVMKEVRGLLPRLRELEGR